MRPRVELEFSRICVLHIEFHLLLRQPSEVKVYLLTFTDEETETRVKN